MAAMTTTYVVCNADGAYLGGQGNWYLSLRMAAEKDTPELARGYAAFWRPGEVVRVMKVVRRGNLLTGRPVVVN